MIYGGDFVFENTEHALSLECWFLGTVYSGTRKSKLHVTGVQKIPLWESDAYRQRILSGQAKPAKYEKIKEAREREARENITP